MRVAVLSNDEITRGVIKDVIGDGPYQIYIDFEHDDGSPVRLPFPDHRPGRGMYLFGIGARAKQQAAIAAAVGEGSAMNEVTAVVEVEGEDVAAADNVNASDDKKVLSPGTRIIKLFYIEVVGENSPFEATVTKWNQLSRLYDVQFDDGEDAKIPWKEMHTSNFITVCHDSAASSAANANVKPTSKKKPTAKKKAVKDITADHLTHIFTEEELEKSDPTMCDCGSVACSTWDGEINVCVECQEG